MKDYTLSKERIAELEKLHRSLRDKRQADRVKAVIALSKGWSAVEVAQILLFDEKTSRHYFERYQQGGLRALLDDNYSGAEPKLGEHQISELEGYLQVHILPDAKSVIAHIDRQYGVRYSVSGATDLLHRLGFSYKKPTHVPGKQDPVKQQAFLEEYEHIKAVKGKNDPIYFADATHPQHNSIPSYGWIKKGQEKGLKANCGRQRLNINGAINIETLEPTTGFYDTVNAEGTKIKLIFLPPYSPNLNLIERYWKFFKKKVLNNRYYETFEEFKRACENFFRRRKKYLLELQVLLAENFHIQAA